MLQFTGSFTLMRVLIAVDILAVGWEKIANSLNGEELSRSSPTELSDSESGIVSSLLIADTS